MRGRGTPAGHSGGPAARLLGRLAAASVARPRALLAGAGVALVLALGLGAARLTVKSSNLDLIDPDLPAVRAFRELAREFGTPNALIVVLEGEDPAALRAAVDRLAPRLAAGPGVQSVLARLPYDPGGLALLGLSPYFTSRDGRLYFLFVQPDDPESRAATIAPFVDGVRRTLARDGLARDGIRAGLTGLPRYALDDQQVVQRDITRLSALSLVLVLGLFVAAFASWVRPLLAMAALLVAVGLTLGLAGLYPGHLTLLSSFFGSILFGLGVDYGIHVVDRVEELLAEGRAVGPAVVGAVEALAPGLATGALTTATAFFTLTLSGFRGFEELGLLAGGGILLCLAAMVTVLPALLVVVPVRRGGERPLLRRRMGRLLARLQSPVLASVVALAALSGAVAVALSGGPAFDQDYLDLQPAGSEAVRLERQMVERSPFSTQFAAFVTGSRRQAAARVAELQADDTVAAVHWAGEGELLAALVGGGEVDGGGEDGARKALASRFVSSRGRYAVYAYPRGDVWDPAVRDRFVDRMRSFDPAATGMPFLGRLMIERSRRALRVAGTASALAVLVWVLADFRRPGPALLALSPALLGVAALAGLMKLLGLSFNPLNVMALPVVLGIAVDDGVHLVHRYLAEQGDLRRTLAGAGRSVVLTSATSIAAFGALAFAAHRGLASFAWTLSLGLGAALVVSVLVLPQAARRLAPSPARRRNQDV